MQMWLTGCNGNLFPLKERLATVNGQAHANKISVILLSVYSLLASFIQVKVKPGESALAFYTAANKSSKPITGVSTYNVTPMKVCFSHFTLQNRNNQRSMSLRRLMTHLLTSFSLVVTIHNKQGKHEIVVRY